MKHKIIGDIFRLILTLFLLLMVYYETGKWTTVSLFLVFIYSEVSEFVQRAQAKLNNEICSLFHRIVPIKKGGTDG